MTRRAFRRVRTPLRAVVLLALSLAAPLGALTAQGTECRYRGAPGAVAERPSPLDSVLVDLGGAAAKLCYGRPSARGRTMVGGQEPFGAPWRLGANEPTTLHVPIPVTLGTVRLEPGSYSLYAIPEPNAWTIVVNGNTNRWGIPISAEVRADDIGSFTVEAIPLDEHVETLEFTFDPGGEGAGALVYRWERTSLRIPVARR